MNGYGLIEIIAKNLREFCFALCLLRRVRRFILSSDMSSLYFVIIVIKFMDNLTFKMGLIEKRYFVINSQSTHGASFTLCGS